MEIKYCYITKTEFTNPVAVSPEFQVEGHDAGGRLLFGFRTSDYFGWRDAARAYTPGKYIPAFDRPAVGA
jgi:hypothetical protein